MVIKAKSSPVVSELTPPPSKRHEMNKPHPRYHAVARSLSVLSPELVHKIFDDLPIGRILELICLYDIPYIEQCALSHYGLSRIFGGKQLQEVKSYFTIYAKLCQERQNRHHTGYPETPVLQRDIASWLRAYKNSSPDVCNLILADIKARIFEILDGYRTYLPTLLRFDDSGCKIPNCESWKYMSSPEDVQKIFDSLHAAENALNSLKAEQLRRICGLLQKYPGMLRNVQNSSQDVRPNAEQHQIRTYQRIAQKMLQLQFVRQQFVANDLFAIHRFPIIPYDRHLRCFLKVVRKYLPENSIIFPSDIHEDIRTVLKGMSYVYTRNLVSNTPGPQLLRTKFTPYSSKGLQTAVGQHQPQFVIGTDPRVPRNKRATIMGEDEWRISDPRDRILPLEEKEFQWLESFLRSCKYMEQIEDVEWTTGTTIGQFWRKHTSAEWTTDHRAKLVT